MPKPRIILMPHDPGWVRAFEEARADIMEACGGRVIDAVHIGSTAIPGIAAKPVIDMLALLRRHRDGVACVPARRQGSNLAVKRVCLVGTSSGKEIQERTTSTCTKSKHPEVRRHMRFRDYLRRHPEASAYETLKRKLAARFGSDTRAYSDAKSEFCARIDRLALDAGP
jgi:GrpB-like predicted nucleotidyltransferase (UPF0157 family)